MNARIHLVATGGTVGSARLDGIARLSERAGRSIADAMPAGIEASWSSPFAILSEDVASTHWTELARHVASLPLNRLDGVVVTHGSDTLAWSSAALAFLLRGVPVPVVLTGADLPPDDPASNGADNIRAAATFAAAERLPGVFACWRNREEPAGIHLGARLLPADLHTDRFRSAGGTAFGTVEDGSFRRIADRANPTRTNLAERADTGEWDASRRRLDAAVPLFEDRVLVLADHPGVDHSPLLSQVGRWKAVVQIAHHSGTACSREGAGTLLDLARACRTEGVPFLLGPAGRHAPYASREPLVEAGARILPDAAWSALVVKIRHLLAGEGLAELERDMAWELLPPT